MSVRLIITLNAAPGMGAEFAEAFAERCREVATEPGCLQFEAFRSVSEPDKLVLLELWESDEALAEHAKMNQTRAPMPAHLRGPGATREDYIYARKG